MADNPQIPTNQYYQAPQEVNSYVPTGASVIPKQPIQDIYTLMGAVPGKGKLATRKKSAYELMMEGTDPYAGLIPDVAPLQTNLRAIDALDHDKGFESYGYSSILHDGDNEDRYAKNFRAANPDLFGGLDLNLWKDLKKIVYWGGGFLEKTLESAVIKTGQGLAGLYGLTIGNTLDAIAGDKFTSFDDWLSSASDNVFSNIFDAWDDNLKERYFYFQEKEDREKKGFIQSLSDGDFWMNDISDGLGFLVSAAFEVGLISKLNLGTKVASRIAPLAEGVSTAPLTATGTVGRSLLGRTVNALGLEGSGAKLVANGVDLTAATLATTTIESMTEANEVKKAVYNSFEGKVNPETGYFYTEEEKKRLSAAAAGQVFKQNMATLIGPKFLETLFFNNVGRYAKSIFGSEAAKKAQQAAGKASGRVRANEGLSGGVTYQRLNALNRAWNSTKIPRLAALGFVSEGLWEENMQLAISREAEETFGAGDEFYRPGTSQDDIERMKSEDDIFGAVGRRYWQQTRDFLKGIGDSRLIDDELSKSVGIGGLFGVLGGGIHGSINARQQAKIDRYWTSVIGGATKNLFESDHFYMTEPAEVNDPANPGKKIPGTKIVLDRQGNPVVDRNKVSAYLNKMSNIQGIMEIISNTEDQKDAQGKTLTDKELNMLAKNVLFSKLAMEYIKAGKKDELLRNLASTSQLSDKDIAALGYSPANMSEQEKEKLLTKLTKIVDRLDRRNDWIENNVLDNVSEKREGFKGLSYTKTQKQKRQKEFEAKKEYLRGLAMQHALLDSYLDEINESEARLGEPTTPILSTVTDPKTGQVTVDYQTPLAPISDSWNSRINALRNHIEVLEKEFGYHWDNMLSKERNSPKAQKFGTFSQTNNNKNLVYSQMKAEEALEKMNALQAEHDNLVGERDNWLRDNKEFSLIQDPDTGDFFVVPATPEETDIDRLSNEKVRRVNGVKREEIAIQKKWIEDEWKLTAALKEEKTKQERDDTYFSRRMSLSKNAYNQYFQREVYNKNATLGQRKMKLWDADESKRVTTKQYIANEEKLMKATRIEGKVRNILADINGQKLLAEIDNLLEKNLPSEQFAPELQAIIDSYKGKAITLSENDKSFIDDLIEQTNDEWMFVNEIFENMPEDERFNDTYYDIDENGQYVVKQQYDSIPALAQVSNDLKNRLDDYKKIKNFLNSVPESLPGDWSNPNLVRKRIADVYTETADNIIDSYNKVSNGGQSEVAGDSFSTKQDLDKVNEEINELTQLKTIFQGRPNILATPEFEGYVESLNERIKKLKDIAKIINERLSSRLRENKNFLIDQVNNLVEALGLTSEGQVSDQGLHDVIEKVATPEVFSKLKVTLQDLAKLIAKEDKTAEDNKAIEDAYWTINGQIAAIHQVLKSNPGEINSKVSELVSELVTKLDATEVLKKSPALIQKEVTANIKDSVLGTLRFLFFSNGLFTEIGSPMPVDNFYDDNPASPVYKFREDMNLRKLARNLETDTLRNADNSPFTNEQILELVRIAQKIQGLTDLQNAVNSTHNLLEQIEKEKEVVQAKMKEAEEKKENKYANLIVPSIQQLNFIRAIGNFMRRNITLQKSNNIEAKKADIERRKQALRDLMKATGDDIFMLGVEDGTFMGEALLNMNENGDVVLTRYTDSEEGLTKGKGKTKNLKDIAGQFGGEQIATSGIEGGAASFVNGVVGEYHIPLQELIDLIKSEDVVFAGLGNKEFVLSPHIADKYLAKINGKEINAKYSEIEAKKADIERRREEELSNLGQKQLTSGFNKLTEAKTPEQAAKAIKDIEQNVSQGAKLSPEQSKQLSDAKEQLKNDGYEIIESPTYKQGEHKIVQSGKEYAGEVLTEQQVEEIESSINSREKRGLDVNVEDLPSPVTRVVKPQLNKDGKMIQAAEVNIIVFDSVEQAKNAIRKSKEAGYKQSKASDKINAKYDAELAELEKINEAGTLSKSESFGFRNWIFIQAPGGAGKTQTLGTWFSTISGVPRDKVMATAFTEEAAKGIKRALLVGEDGPKDANEMAEYINKLIADKNYEQEVLIIDEFPAIDIDTQRALFQAVQEYSKAKFEAGKGTFKVVTLGDVNQLTFSKDGVVSPISSMNNAPYGFRNWGTDTANKYQSEHIAKLNVVPSLTINFRSNLFPITSFIENFKGSNQDNLNTEMKVSSTDPLLERPDTKGVVAVSKAEFPNKLVSYLKASIGSNKTRALIVNESKIAQYKKTLTDAGITIITDPNDEVTKGIYVGTVRSVQGFSFDEVFIDVEPNDKTLFGSSSVPNFEYNKAMYVAASRARNLIVVTNFSKIENVEDEGIADLEAKAIEELQTKDTEFISNRDLEISAAKAILGDKYATNVKTAAPVKAETKNTSALDEEEEEDEDEETSDDDVEETKKETEAEEDPTIEEEDLEDDEEGQDDPDVAPVLQTDGLEDNISDDITSDETLESEKKTIMGQIKDKAVQVYDKVRDSVVKLLFPTSQTLKFKIKDGSFMVKPNQEYEFDHTVAGDQVMIVPFRQDKKSRSKRNFGYAVITPAKGYDGVEIPNTYRTLAVLSDKEIDALKDNPKTKQIFDDIEQNELRDKGFVSLLYGDISSEDGFKTTGGKDIGEPIAMGTVAAANTVKYFFGKNFKKFNHSEMNEIINKFVDSFYANQIEKDPSFRQKAREFYNDPANAQIIIPVRKDVISGKNTKARLDIPEEMQDYVQPGKPYLVFRPFGQKSGMQFVSLSRRYLNSSEHSEVTIPIQEFISLGKVVRGILAKKGLGDEKLGYSKGLSNMLSKLTNEFLKDGEKDSYTVKATFKDGDKSVAKEVTFTNVEAQKIVNLFTDYLVPDLNTVVTNTEKDILALSKVKKARNLTFEDGTTIYGTVVSYDPATKTSVIKDVKNKEEVTKAGAISHTAKSYTGKVQKLLNDIVNSNGHLADKLKALKGRTSFITDRDRDADPNKAKKDFTGYKFMNLLGSKSGPVVKTYNSKGEPETYFEDVIDILETLFNFAKKGELPGANIQTLDNEGNKQNIEVKFRVPVPLNARDESGKLTHDYQNAPTNTSRDTGNVSNSKYFETNFEGMLPVQVYVEFGEPEKEQQKEGKLNEADKIVWAHPGIGKTYVKEKGRKDVIDFDSDYKSKINTEKGLAPGFKARSEWRKNNKEEWKTLVRKLWKEAKEEAKKTGKILMASDIILLREFSKDFDKVVTMSEKTFVDRAKQRNDYTKGDTESWKYSLDTEINKIPKEKVIYTSKYMSDILPAEERQEHGQSVQVDNTDDEYSLNQLEKALADKMAALMDNGADIVTAREIAEKELSDEDRKALNILRSRVKKLPELTEDDIQELSFKEIRERLTQEQVKKVDKWAEVNGFESIDNFFASAESNHPDEQVYFKDYLIQCLL